MRIRIGILKALLYYRYFTYWIPFFKSLDFEVVISQPKSRELIDEGFRYADEDSCIPIKIAFGHALSLKREVDFLFIPRLLSLDPKSCFCPRTAGLPEMLKYSIQNLPPILDPYIDERYSDSRLLASLTKMGRRLGKKTKEIKEAFQCAERAYQNFWEKIKKEDLPPELYPHHPITNSGNRIAILGHPYCLYDPFLNFDTLRLLEGAGASILTQERVLSSQIDIEIKKFGKEIYWTFGREILGAGLHYLHSREVEGIIYITCFSCGVDSMIEPLLSYRIKKDGGVLYLCLMIDEHTGAGGVKTRLEAFLETMERRKRGFRRER